MSKFVTIASWRDVPHLSEEAKAEIEASIPPYQRDARMNGIPVLGAGAIYQVSEVDVRVKDFELPKHWPRGFALDTGWEWTAATWHALDRETQTLYLYSVYKRRAAEVPIHADAIKGRGLWIPGVGDAAAINNNDGEQFIAHYRRHGIDLNLADKSVEAGIQQVWELLSAGRYKVFASCEAWFEEYRLYRRDENGKIVKANDHLMDCSRMFVRSGRARMKTEPAKELVTTPPQYLDPATRRQNWMQ